MIWVPFPNCFVAPTLLPRRPISLPRRVFVTVGQYQMPQTLPFWWPQSGSDVGLSRYKNKMEGFEFFKTFRQRMPCLSYPIQILCHLPILHLSQTLWGLCNPWSDLYNICGRTVRSTNDSVFHAFLLRLLIIHVHFVYLNFVTHHSEVPNLRSHSTAHR